MSAAAHELDDDYRRAGFGARMSFGKRPALLLVDLVSAYVDPGSPLYAAPFVAALGPNTRLLLAARQAGIPVLFTCVRFDASGKNGGQFFRKVPALACFAGDNAPLGAFVPGLEPIDGEVVVVKQYASAFFGTSLAATLTSQRIDTVLVTGFSTSGCVRASAVDAMQHGFAPFVVREACADRDLRPHEANLFDLQAKYAEVIDLDQALVAMSGSSVDAA
jgi:maleamate amidohydrolase